MRDWSDLQVVAVVLLAFTFFSVSSFMYGRHVGKMAERKALTRAIIEQTEEVYYTGYGDGAKACLEGRLH